MLKFKCFLCNAFRGIFKSKNPLKTMEKVCFYFGLLSIVFSVVLIVCFGNGSDLVSAQNQRLAIFVGLWAPTLIAIANYLKGQDC